MAERFTYTIPEAAQAIGIGRTMAYKLINEGSLRTVRVGKRVLIPRASIIKLLGMEAVESPTVETSRNSDSGERTYIVTIRSASSVGITSTSR